MLLSKCVHNALKKGLFGSNANHSSKVSKIREINFGIFQGHMNFMTAAEN